MLDYVKFEKKHIPDVKILFDTLLVPNYLRRMGITKDDVTREVMKLESILQPTMVLNEIYEGCSAVCIDTDTDQVVGCSMNYVVTEEEYFDFLIKPYKNYLLRENGKKSLRDYAEAELKSNSHDAFRKYNLKKVMYGETIIVIPKYRGKGVSNTLFSFSCSFLDDDVDGIITQSQIPVEHWKKISVDRVYAPNQLILGELENNGFVCVSVLVFLKENAASSKL